MDMCLFSSFSRQKFNHIFLFLKISIFCSWTPHYLYTYFWINLMVYKIACVFYVISLAQSFQTNLTRHYIHLHFYRCLTTFYQISIFKFPRFVTLWLHFNTSIVISKRYITWYWKCNTKKEWPKLRKFQDRQLYRII